MLRVIKKRQKGMEGEKRERANTGDADEGKRGVSCRRDRGLETNALRNGKSPLREESPSQPARRVCLLNCLFRNSQLPARLLIGGRACQGKRHELGWGCPQRHVKNAAAGPLQFGPSLAVPRRGRAAPSLRRILYVITYTCTYTCT